jgi:hypothetical protein
MSGAMAGVWAWAGDHKAAASREMTDSDGMLKRDIGFSTKSVKLLIYNNLHSLVERKQRGRAGPGLAGAPARFIMSR